MNLLPFGLHLLLRLLAEDPQRVLHFALLGQDAGLFLLGGLLAAPLRALELGQPGLHGRERLELLQRDRHGLLGRGGRRRAAGAGPP